MARQCEICGKKPIFGRQYKKLISRYNPTPKRKQKPNLQWARVPVGMKKEPFKKFAGKRVLACTKCRKTILKYGV